MWEIFYIENLYIIFGVAALVFLCACEYLNTLCPYKNTNLCCYGYGILDGPHTWKVNYPNADGHFQSPVNLVTSCAMVVPVETLPCPLRFSREYHLPPSCLTLINDGHTINLYPDWGDRETATIKGGPLNGPYKFHNIRFRWGPNDEEGTEHMIDNKRYAMELQATYVGLDHSDVIIAAEAGEVVMITYLFQVTPVDNPYLEVLLTHIGRSNVPFSRHIVESIPISLLAPPFTRGFFSYIGSLSYPPCTEGIRWIVQPEPLTISKKQIKRFRKTPAPYCSLLNNTRPVQELNGRDVILYD